jgi:hypothetical protein
VRQTGITVKVSSQWTRWERGMGSLSTAMRTEGRRRWQAVTDVMFDRSQGYAHVLSGENKASGSSDTTATATELVGTIEYDSDHAIYEEARGGSHAFIGRAWEATEADFRRTMPETWEAVVNSWK